ncbi:MAG TPA: hypothetical protein VJU84_09540 [Pyrinomonadaceae bacterium]|nr:hypothetical protein [Pyrinomonadaceae bacterium]
MLKTMVIVIAVLIAVVNVSAQTVRTQKSGRRVHQATAIRVGPPTTYLKEGLTAEQVLRVLGQPIRVSEREEQGVTIKTLFFQRGANRILVAEFVNDALVSSRTETRVPLVASNGY